ncbi:MAG: c-type cytochrome domain-containing protein, partial [Opitutales bacterium]
MSLDRSLAKVMKMLFRFLVPCVLVFSLPVVPSASEPSFQSLAQPFLENYCLDCHDEETKKGDLALDGLTGVNAENFGIWKRMWEQVALKEMPPKKKKKQPAAIDRVNLSQWILGGLEQVMEDKGGFDSHHLPAKGNHLDHDLLFGKVPKDLEPASTPARIWRIHPQEHLVRLNELINKEPEYNPKTPGLRTRGDHIPWNNQGEVKVYYGLDRIMGQVGGSAAYAAAITGFSPILHTSGLHGLRSYPVLYSVNGAQASQIARHAEDIIRFMAYGPKIEPYQLGPSRKLPEKYKGVDIRGTVESLFYKEEVMRPLTPVYDLVQEENPSEEGLRAAVGFLIEALAFREPSAKESDVYLKILKESVADLGLKDGVILGLIPIFLDRDALFRPELAQYGKPDEHGRVMLQGHELALAVNGAFSYLKPDAELKKVLKEGRLKTRDDVRREVTRMLSDESIR